MTTAFETIARPRLRGARPVLSFGQAGMLAEEHGTPLLVVSRTRLRENYEAMRAGLPGVELFYAAKANPDPVILSTLCALGSSVDVCSFREMQAALVAGFTPDAMLHTHPCKTERNLLDCYGEGLRWFVFDSGYEIARIARHTADVNLLLRLAAPANSSLINLSSKFGAAPEEALGLMEEARRAGLSVRGMSFHVGSQCLAPEDFHTALSRARRLWDAASHRGFDLEVLDVGGGFPAPYRTAVMSLEDFCRSLSQALDETFGDLPVRVIAEPGRGLCADAATLVTRVLGKSTRGGVTWYIIDDGLYGSFSGIVYDHAAFPLLTEDGGRRPTYPCVVAGPTCDSSDVVCRDLELPDLDVGDLLLVPSMGAYTSASASGFNGLDVARVVGIDTEPLDPDAV